MPFGGLLTVGILGAAGSGAQAAGGKKGANKIADQQAQQLAFSKQQYNTGLSAWQPAKDYWTALLQGGPAATTAVGPYAGQIRTQGTGAARAITSALPAGGERNLALANSNAGTYSQIQRLTAGVQPTAASALGSLSAPLIGASTSTSGQATSLTPTLAQVNQNSKAANADNARGLGNLVYNAMNKNNKQNGTGGTPPFAGGK